MFQLNDKIYRNLEEQVLQNKEDIARHYNIDRVLADFGITVLGRVNTPADLPETENENWGYGFLVGEEVPYDVYVWTRANPDVGEDAPYWLNIGKISIVGPEGPAGRSVSNVSINANNQLVFNFSDGSTLTLAQSIKGDKGDPGANGKTPSITTIRENNGVRVSTFNGDGALTNSVFIPDGQNGQSIVGPQGIPGKSLNILGTFTSTAQFPTASTAEMGDACILQTGGTTTLYMLTGTPDEPSTYAWAETTFGGGTEVTVNGTVQSTWNADTKLDKVISGGSYRLYGVDSAGDQVMLGYNQGVVSLTMVQRNVSGQIQVPATPTATNHATSKQYVDSQATELRQNIDAIDLRVSTLENSSGGSSGGSSWNVITSPTGTPLTFNPTYGAFYEVMLYSEHGIGDNLYTSNVFLFKADQAFIYGTSQILPVGAVGATTADIYFYWKVEYQYNGTGGAFVFTPIYGSDPSSIHDVKLYYKQI